MNSHESLAIRNYTAARLLSWEYDVHIFSKLESILERNHWPYQHLTSDWTCSTLRTNPSLPLPVSAIAPTNVADHCSHDVPSQQSKRR
jgi:hypothetical protein